MDVKRIKQDLERIESKGDFRLQTQTVTLLISQVREYVAQIAQEETIASSVAELEREIRKNPETPEEKESIETAKQALQTAQRIKQNMNMKKAALRSLGNDVHALSSEIRKVT